MKNNPKKPVIGWRELVLLPELSSVPFPCKVDTGAASSSLDAIVLGTESRTDRRGRPCEWVRFLLPSLAQFEGTDFVHAAPMLETRSVRSSNGETASRPVILTGAILMGQAWTIEITLNDRNRMGYPMLLGRKALRNRFHVNVARSWIGGSPGKIRQA